MKEANMVVLMFGLCVMTLFIGMWGAIWLSEISSMDEITININLTSDNNTLQMIETIERIQKLELKHSNNELNTTNNSLN